MERILYLLILLWVSARFSLWLHVKACEKYPDFAAALLSTRGLYVLIGSCIVQYATFPTLRNYLTPLFTESTILSFSVIFLFYTLVPWMLLGWVQHHALSNFTLTNLYCVLIEQLVMGFCFAPMFFSIFDDSTADASSPTTIVSNGPIATASIGGGGGGFIKSVLSAIIVPLTNTTTVEKPAAVPMNSGTNPLFTSMSESVLIITTINVADRVVEGLAVFSYLLHHLRPLTKDAAVQKAVQQAAADGHRPAQSTNNSRAGQFTLPPSRPLMALESQGMVQNFDTMIQHLTHMWRFSNPDAVIAPMKLIKPLKAHSTAQNSAATTSATLAIVQGRDLDRLVVAKLDGALRQREHEQNRLSESSQNDEDGDEGEIEEKAAEPVGDDGGGRPCTKPSSTAVGSSATVPAAPCEHNVGFVPIGPAVSRDEEMLVSDTPDLPADMQHPNDEMKPDMDNQSSASLSNKQRGARRRRGTSTATASSASSTTGSQKRTRARRARDSSESSTEQQTLVNRRQGMPSRLAQSTAANNRHHELFPDADASNIFDDDNDTPVGHFANAAAAQQHSVFSSGDEALLVAPHGNSRQQHKSMKWVSFASNVDKPSPSTEGPSSSSTSTPPPLPLPTFRRPPVPPRWEHQEQEEPAAPPPVTSSSYFSSSAGDDTDTAAAGADNGSFVEPLKQRKKRSRRNSASRGYGKKKRRSSSRLKSRKESGD